MILSKRKKYKQLIDSQLIELFRSSADKLILAEIYNRYGHLVFGTCLKYLKNTENAEDITMIIFEKLHDKVSTNDIQYFKSWLYMVTKNECLMYLRKRKLDTTELIMEPSSENEVDFDADKEKQLVALEGSIEELKDPQKTCIELFYIKGMSYTEIAVQLNLEIKKVKSAIQNGKRNLKLILEARDEFK